MRSFSILLLAITSVQVFSAETSSDSIRPGERTIIHFDGAFPGMSGMGHQLCKAEPLQEAIRFLDDGL